MHFFPPILGPGCPLVPTAMFHCTAGPLSCNPKSCSLLQTSLQQTCPQCQCSWPQFRAAQLDAGCGLTVRDYCSKRASGPPQETYWSSILFVNNKALYSQEVEEKCPQHFPFEMQSAGDQNIKYSIHFKSLTTQVRDLQTQQLALGRHPWWISQNKSYVRIDQKCLSQKNFRACEVWQYRPHALVLNIRKSGVREDPGAAKRCLECSWLLSN